MCVDWNQNGCGRYGVQPFFLQASSCFRLRWREAESEEKS
jgi:hypothetical protein